MLPHQFFTQISNRDRSLMLALDLHEESICSCGCGQPIDLARNPLVDWDVGEVVCYARRALDADKTEREPGAFPVVTPDPKSLEWLEAQDED